MQSYAQTYPQLVNQLRALGYSRNDLILIRESYEVAMALYSARFQPSGKSFMAHLVGTASVLASVRVPSPLVSAGLLHNAYATGDFGDGNHSVTTRRRRRIVSAVGHEVEQYVARFPTVGWKSPEAKVATNNPAKLDPVDRGAFLILIADQLDHLSDLDFLYYRDRERQNYFENCGPAIEAAESLGMDCLAAELKQRIEHARTQDLPVELPEKRVAGGAFVVAPGSSRKRLGVTLREGLIRQRRYWLQRIPRFRRYREALRNIIRQTRSKDRDVGRLDPKSTTFTTLFSDGGRIERIATGFQFTEGPVWLAEERSLLFSDIPASCIFRLKSDHSVEIFRQPSGHSNGLTRDRKGRLITCEHGHRQVTRTEADGSITILANQFQGKLLNSPNDVVVKSDGSIYFSDPAYGIRPEQQEQPLEGVYRLSADGTRLALVAADFKRPNGLAFSPDETIMYIDDSERRHVVAFKVRSDGSLHDPSVFHDMNVPTPGAPDGMKVDTNGRLFCTGAGGVWVFDPDGTHLGTIVTPEKPSNCAWGDEDWRTLYITAVSSIYRIRVSTPGVRA